MKRTAILHGDLSRLVALMGHGDLLVIGDAGLPVPPGVPLMTWPSAPACRACFRCWMRCWRNWWSNAPQLPRKPRPRWRRRSSSD